MESLLNLGLEKLVRDADTIMADAIDRCFERAGEEGLDVFYLLALDRLVHRCGGNGAAVTKIVEKALVFADAPRSIPMWPANPDGTISEVHLREMEEWSRFTGVEPPHWFYAKQI